MSREEFIEVYQRCFEKVSMKYSWALTEDYDEDLEVYVDAQGNIFIKDIKLPYHCKNITRVKYRNYEYDEYDEESYILIKFDNNDFLQLGESGYMDYIHLYVNNEEGPKSYQDKSAYEYLKKKEESLS